MTKIAGSCLCGTVTFEVTNDFNQFHLCHCLQCQKMTGSAHASNLFCQAGNISWLGGVDKTKRFDYQNDNFHAFFVQSVALVSLI